MRRLLSLPGLAISIWLTWLGLLCLLYELLANRVWNPHFLPVMSALAAVIAAAALFLACAVRRILRGPGRRRALACLLLGAAPILFLAGHLLFGLSFLYQRYMPENLVLKLLIPLCASLIDLEARFYYPQRTIGEKVVMISAPTPDAARQVEAMDRHVRAMEARLGRPVWGRTHWVRGSLQGMDANAIVGLCPGNPPGVGAPDADGLTDVDRHEVAHCVIHGHCSAQAYPPALLVEGWAEANSGHEPAEQAATVWELHEAGRALSR
jgi:hypothetical protein